MTQFNFLQKIYWRLALILLGMFLLVGVFSATMILRSSNNHQQQIVQIMHANLAKHVVKEYLLFEGGEINLKAAKQTFHDLMVLGPNFEFYVLDEAGKILAYSADPSKIKRESVDLVPIKEFIQGDKKDELICGDDPRSLTKIKVFTASPIKGKNAGIEGRDDEVLGYLYVILGSEIYDGIADLFFDNKIIQWGIWIILSGLLFSLLTTLFLTGLITRPLRRLTEQVHTLRHRGFSYASKREGNKSEKVAEEFSEWCDDCDNEIHILGSAFKTLLEKLEEQYGKIVTVDELRRELLTHISHDLRTPLASLLGYLETWEMNSDKLDKKESDKYIAIARRSAEKISTLVEQLFELAHLDSGTVQINIERFSLAELAQDVIQKFAIDAQKKQVNLEVTPQDSSILVSGDIEKLERVFTNLIENALRHTEAGGTITVRLSPEQKFVGVEVADTGIGIPKEDLPHVFDAHFKAGNSVRGNSANGGIGLAITKKIIDLHKSRIDVSSQVDHGTTFKFMLPAV